MELVAGKMYIVSKWNADYPRRTFIARVTSVSADTIVCDAKFRGYDGASPDYGTRIYPTAFIADWVWTETEEWK